MRKTIASPSATTTSKAMAMATTTKVSETTLGTPKTASQTTKLRLSSAIRVARSQEATTRTMSKSRINNARYTRSRGIRSSSASLFENHSMHHPSPKQESERIRRMTKKGVTSRGVKTSRIRKTSSTSSSVETADSPPSVRRS
jgi:hypothetical protein